jgi:hypothetical protein
MSIALKCTKLYNALFFSHRYSSPEDNSPVAVELKNNGCRKREKGWQKTQKATDQSP